ncbi:MAG: DUF3006 domain-containing protein, partial [Enterocloster sp.]
MQALNQTHRKDFYMKYIIDRLEEGLAICETELRKRIS